MTNTSNGVVKRAIVIGSGFGGSVTACRLVQAARQKLDAHEERWEVIVIERGRKYGKDDFPRLQLPESMTSSEDLKSSQRFPDFGRFSWRTDYGLFDTRNLGGLLVMQAAGLGGGSLIYANVLLRAPESELQKWPGVYHSGPLAPYYELAEKMLGAAVAPSRYDKTKVFEEAVEALGRKVIKLPLAVNFPSEPGAAEGTAKNAFNREQGTCNGCGDCVIGCTRHAKNTLDLNYLAIVEDDPLAQIWTMAEVTQIERRKPGDRTSGEGREFVVTVVRHDQAEKAITEEADYVFLCAGAIGTTELLWQNRESLGLSEAAKAEVGKRLFGNGDSLGVVFETAAPATPWVGPTITRGMVHVEPDPPNKPKDGRRRQRTSNDSATWFMLQDGGIPPSLRRILGYFHSGMWLGRNRFKSPRSPVAAEPQRAGPLTDLFLDLPLLTGLFHRSREQSSKQKESVWRRYVPKDISSLVELLSTPQDRLIKEIGEIDKLVLERVQVEFGRRFGLASWFPGLRSFFNQDLLLESVLGALRERYKVLGYLPKSHDFVGSLLATAVYLVFGHGPTANSHVLLCMGPDDAWTLRCHEGGHFRADRDRAGEHGDVNLYGIQDRVLRDLAKQLGGELRTNPNWTVGRRPVTVHAQGGSGMTTQVQGSALVEQPGVTDEDGRVLGNSQDWPHLYVMDAAGFPGSVGVNPSLTVAAVAERKIQQFINASALKPENGFVARSPVPSKLEEVARVNAMIETQPTGHTPIGLQWSEWMDGSVGDDEALLAPNVWACSNGEKLGLSKGRYMHMALSCEIDDLEGFYLQAAPRVRVRGKTTIRDKLGTHVYSTEGKDDGSLTLEFEGERMARMVYDLKLRASGKPDKRLRGTKFLNDDAGLDSFLDLTTLFVAISDAGQPGLAQPGVARVPFVTFVSKQVPTFELTGSEDLDAFGRAWALTRFADFFFAGLKRTYLPELFVKRIPAPPKEGASNASKGPSNG